MLLVGSGIEHLMVDCGDNGEMLVDEWSNEVYMKNFCFSSEYCMSVEPYVDDQLF